MKRAQTFKLRAILSYKRPAIFILSTLYESPEHLQQRSYFKAVILSSRKLENSCHHRLVSSLPFRTRVGFQRYYELKVLPPLGYRIGNFESPKYW